MNWDKISFDWNRARAFLATAEEGSLSGAARALGLAQPTVGRQIAALEQELQVALIEHSGRGVQLTPVGLALLEPLRAMAEAAHQVHRLALGQSDALEGSVTLSASQVIAAYLLPPVLQELRRQHPGITLDVVATQEASDLRHREADIAVRSFRPTDPELVARRIRLGRAWLYASASYLERLGHPTEPQQLRAAEFIGFDHTPRLLERLNALGLALTQDNFPWITANQLVQWEMVKRGMGIGVMMEEVGRREPLVTRVLPEILSPLEIPLWLVSHREVKMSRRVRVVFEHLAQALASPPPPTP